MAARQSHPHLVGGPAGRSRRASLGVMTVQSRSRDRERALVELARQGDEGAFADLVEVHRGELTAHCYRMLGSFHDAEDAVQDAFLRAWRAMQGFGGRSSVRSWLYAIVTNTALDIAKRRTRRELSPAHAPAAARGTIPGDLLSDPVWLEPYPDRELAEPEPSPEARYEQRESLELAFVVALQNLPPLQRAVLILREVAGFSAREIAAQLSTSEPAVNSALQRARAAAQDKLPTRSQQVTLRALGDDRVRALAERYADAIEAGRTDVLVQMLTAEASWAMPPLRTWYQGLPAITDFLENHVFPERWRHAITRANGQLAVACYTFDPGRSRYVASVVDVLTLDGARIAAVTGFLTAELLRKNGLDGALSGARVFADLGLPAELE
jgi:RNA polymerase sigma-70 factor (ECF subfamily)